MKKKKEVVNDILPTICPTCGKELSTSTNVLLFDASTETEVLRETVKRCDDCNTDYFVENSKLATQHYFPFGLPEPKWVKPMSDQELSMVKMKELTQSN
jgi:hypothetical protein